MKLIIKILLIIFLFSLGIFGYFQLQDAISKSSYELTQAQGMFPDEPFRMDIHTHYIRKILLYWTITLLGPLFGTVFLITLRRHHKAAT